MIADQSHETNPYPFLRMKRTKVPWPHGKSPEDRALYSDGYYQPVERD
jgi:hypothetical protein